MLLPVVIGIAFGVAGAFALTRLIESMLFGVSTNDPWLVDHRRSIAVPRYRFFRRLLARSPGIAHRSVDSVTNKKKWDAGFSTFVAPEVWPLMAACASS
jgi:hypothetical protein